MSTLIEVIDRELWLVHQPLQVPWHPLCVVLLCVIFLLNIWLVTKLLHWPLATSLWWWANGWLVNSLACMNCCSCDLPEMDGNRSAVQGGSQLIPDEYTQRWCRSCLHPMRLVLPGVEIKLMESKPLGRYTAFTNQSRLGTRRSAFIWSKCTTHCLCIS